MKFDTKVPSELRKTQEWFASIITRPIDENNKMLKLSPSGKPMSEEAKKFIVPSRGLKSHERIEIYNQQYWWRLLSILHENFPLVTRLFGYYEFNQNIGFPYLVKYPPSDWSLNHLGCSLSKWVDECYLEKDKELIENAVLIDYAYNISFFAEKKQPINFETSNLEQISREPITLQPHVHLFEFNSNLFKFRAEMQKESPEYWLENDFPVLEKGEFYFILYRNHQNYIYSDTLSKVAYQILKAFQEGASIDSICEWLDSQDEDTCMEAMQNMQIWFRDWSALQLLILK